MTPQTGYAVTITAREQAELLPAAHDPGPLGPKEVAGRTLASLISAGTELAGQYLGERFPSVPGYASVFEVEATGSGVEGIGLGDRLFYVNLRSGWEWELPRQPAPFRTNSIFGNLRAALDWLAAGEIRVDHLYTLLPPRDAQRAYQELLHQRSERLAVVFDWSQLP